MLFDAAGRAERRQKQAVEALTLGLTFAHVLELPQRIAFDAELWMSLTEPNALYRCFGVIGGPIEVAAVAGVIVLAVSLRHHRPAGRLAAGPAVLHAAALPRARCATT